MSTPRSTTFASATANRQQESNGLINPPSILVSAFGIHTGGGYVLLKALMENLGCALKAVSLDERLGEAGDAFVTSHHFQVLRVRKSFIARILSLFRLAAIAMPGDTLLCFNSLPPLRRICGRVVTYVHAPHFVDAHLGIRYAPLTVLRIMVERQWFRLGIANSDEVWVQTRSMAEALLAQYPHVIVKIVPFVDDELAERLNTSSQTPPPSSGAGEQFSFFYPAEAVGHKNHVNLLKAWAMLEQEGKRPKLMLTLNQDEWQRLVEQVPTLVRTQVHIENLGRIPREAVLERLQHCSALIFPSQAETFGLPMLEARAFDVPILASERVFVRDVCSPAQTFDPDSPRSIAMAVSRFIDGAAPPHSDYCSARQFLARLLTQEHEASR